MRSISNRSTKKLENLFILADENNIPIDEDCPIDIISMSVRFSDGSKVIGLSNEESATHKKYEALAHELGHCMTDSFYEGYSPFELRAKHEHRANTWAVNKIVPFNELCDAVKQGCRELWELAEHFGVSNSFMKKAIILHEKNGNIVPKQLYEE